MDNIAKIKTTRTVKIVGHYCKACNLTDPPLLFEGIVREDRIEWPILYNYHISYCPHCGGKLPKGGE